MSDEQDKKNLAASGGIADLLGITSNDGSDPSTRSGGRVSDVPSDLPIADSIESAEPIEATAEPVEPETKPSPEPINDVQPEPPKNGNSVWKIVKSILPYLVIFLIALGLYFFYFSDFSFQSLFKNNLRLESLTSDNRDENLEKIKDSVATDYNEWIAQFFVDVNDDSIISMDADVSGNGLTNLEKYLLNLNPKVYSTQGNVGDGQAVLEGINPWTGKTFTEKQKQLVEKYINKELISNRITAAAITRGVTKYSQYVTSDSPYYIDPETLRELPPSTPVTSDPNPIPTTPPPTPTTPPPPSNLRDDESIDTSKQGKLDIPANNISVPITWTQDVKNFDKDLKKGVVHYPGTAMPGETGTAYISGHSSGYLWDKSPYKQIFATLGSVQDGTSFSITATQKNGRTVKFNYIVERRGEFAANDQAQFISTADSVVALSTCWPVGTVDRRLVLFGKLTQTERN